MKIRLLVILAIIVVFLLLLKPALRLVTQCLYGPPQGERVATAVETPEYCGEVTDIRFTSVPRTQKIFTKKGDDAEHRYIQILYGYMINGIWHDIPCENYNFYCISPRHKGESEFSLSAYNSHLTVIGEYIVICIVCGDNEEVPYDTLGTVPETPFLEYSQSETFHYGIISDDRERIINGDEPAYSVCSSIGYRYYFVIRKDLIDSKYELCLGDSKVSYDDISEYINIIDN